MSGHPVFVLKVLETLSFAAPVSCRLPFGSPRLQGFSNPVSPAGSGFSCLVSCYWPASATNTQCSTLASGRQRSLGAGAKNSRGQK